MKISQLGIDLIKHFEGYRIEAYQDSVGVWTIGYGHTHLIEKGDVLSNESHAELLLKLDLYRFEDEVNVLCKDMDLKQQEFDALVSFAFNLGSGALRRSTLMKHLVAGNKLEAAVEFPKWVYAGGKPLLGLILRRCAEQRLFLGLPVSFKS